MILEMDLGNSRFKWRLRDANKIIAQGDIPAGSLFHELDTSLANYFPLIELVLVASVVGYERDQQFIAWSKRCFAISPVFAKSTPHCAGVTNGYAEPELLGVDRWLGIISVYNRCRTAFVLVSFGTAVTVDVVLQNGGHVGGFIAPGVNLMLDSLTKGTRQVAPDRKVGEFTLRPGVTTTGAVYSAITAMLIGLIKNATREFDDESIHKIEIIFTGGDAHKFLPFYPGAKYMADVVLDGLMYVLGDSKKLEQ